MLIMGYQLILTTPVWWSNKKWSGFLEKKGLFVVGTYCNIIKRKGLDQLLKLAKANAKVAIVIIGNGPEKETLIKLAKELGVIDRCLFYRCCR